MPAKSKTNKNNIFKLLYFLFRITAIKYIGIEKIAEEWNIKAIATNIKKYMGFFSITYRNAKKQIDNAIPCLTIFIKCAYQKNKYTRIERDNDILSLK